MVTAPIVLLLAVTPNPGGISMARDAATACLDSLPAEARSIVRVAPVAPQDSEVIAETSGSGAAAVVILSWHDASLLTTEVRVFVVSPQDGVTHWITRTIVFSARDLASERGRALGLVIASVLDESWGIEALARAEPPAPVVAGLREAGRIEDQPVSVVTRVEPLEFPAEPPRWALEANVTTAVDHLWDVDDSIGGMVGLRRLLSSRWALRTGLGFRVADIDGANATGRTVLGAMGVVWTGAGSERPKAFNFGARFDLLGVHESIQHAEGGPATSRTESYWSMGADLLAQVGYGLSPGTALGAGIGVEEILTEADVYVAGEPAAMIPHTRVVLELGVLSRF
jgi:hypothetical protein